MLTPDRYRARGAFLRFQHALDNLEHEMKPLELSTALYVDLMEVSRISRRFFDRANQELFQQNPAEPVNPALAGAKGGR